MDLEKTAIERIRTASQMSLQHYGLPLVVTDSGGKDSAVCRELVRRSGVPFELMHNLTTADAPQTIYYVREQFQKAEQAGITCSINKPYYKGQRITMWSLIPMKMIPPTRTIRYCCEVLKEMVGLGVLSPQVSGGQKAESGGKTGGFMKTLSQMEKNVPLF